MLHTASDTHLDVHAGITRLSFHTQRVVKKDLLIVGDQEVLLDRRRSGVAAESL